jgi:hypothetical protein
VLIQYQGLLGLAWATVAASLIIDLIAIPLMLQRHVGLRLLSMVKASCPRPLLVSLLLAGICVSIRSVLPAPMRFFDLIYHGLAAGCAAAALVLAFGVTAEERRRFVWSPMQRLRFRG